MILSCVAGPDNIPIKEGFERSLVESISSSSNKKINGDYLTYPFVPDGSDERQFHLQA